MKAKKQQLLSTNRFLTHPSRTQPFYITASFQQKTPLSAYRSDVHRVKKATYQFSLGKQENSFD